MIISGLINAHPFLFRACFPHQFLKIFSIITEKGTQLRKQAERAVVHLSVSIINTIILMMQSKHRSPDKADLLKYNTERILNSDFSIIPLNVKLTSNPFLKDQEKFHFLIYKLNDYNKRITNKQVQDQYEVMVYERLHSVICDLAYIFTKDDQIARLEQTVNWFNEQEKLLNQRKDQGEVRYQMTKEVRYGVVPQPKETNVSQKSEVGQIPSKAVARATLPFKRGWRTTHKELDIPPRRLNEYKRKLLNIAPFIEPKEEKKVPRILYPKIPRFEPKYEEPEEAAEQVEGQPGEGQPLEGQVGPDGQPIIEGEQPAQQKQAEQQQDLGGFGEEPAEPEEEEPPQDDDTDKLAPKLKSYTLEYRDWVRKQYKGPYQFYKGEEHEPERRMEQRYLKMYQTQVQKQKQDSNSIYYLEEWGAKKGKMEKDWQKKLENKLFRSHYNFSAEEPPKVEMLSKDEQIKYGLTQNLRTKAKYTEVNMTDRTLPSINSSVNNQQNQIYEKSIRKDRLNTLKNKFSKLLNLKDYEEREVARSICQYTSRKRGLSEIIKNHSKSKERLNQLDEVTRIKEKLARNKVGVDVRSLSMGLVAPEREQDAEEFMAPGKDLPSNPFMVETKKKKKKK